MSEDPYNAYDPYDTPSKVIDLDRERQWRFWRKYMASSDGAAIRRAALKFFGRTTPRKDDTNEGHDES